MDQSRAAVKPIMLCRRCGDIDLLAVFEGEGEHIRANKEPIRAAFEQRNCALCQLVYRSIARANADHYTTDQLMDPNLTYTLRPKMLENEDKLRHSNMAEHWQVHIQCRGTEKPKHAKARLNSPRPLDVVGNSFNDSQNPNRHFMRRKLMNNTFNITDLKTWLAICEQGHKRKSRLSAYNSEASLLELVSSNRFRLIDVQEAKMIVASEECRFFALSYVWGDTAFHGEWYSPYEGMTRSAKASADRSEFGLDRRLHSLKGFNDKKPGLSDITHPDIAVPNGSSIGTCATSSAGSSGETGFGSAENGRGDFGGDDKASSNQVWSIDWNRVPRTIREAAALVKGLNERYLWVDALCINQHDEQDKQTLIALMDAIYETAYLTIVAASGDDADAGLARFTTNDANKNGDTEEDIVTCQTSQGELNLASSRPGMASLLRRSKWGSRGWTYQEFVLSRRAVCFTEQEVFFACEEGILREAYELIKEETIVAYRTIFSKKEKHLSLREILMDGIQINFETYCSAVEEYTRRKLSHVGDRLDAFAGILCRMDALQPKDYLYTFNGLPSQWFYPALAWESHSHNGATVRVDAGNSQVMPSWSWTGWTGGVSLSHSRSNAYNPLLVKVVDRYNIVGTPVEEDFWWKNCPTRPILAPRSRPSCTTLHLFAPIFRCSFVKERNRSHGSVQWGVFARETITGANTKRLGHITRSYGLLSPPAAEIIALPSDSDPTDRFMFGIIFEQRDGFARRVSSLQIHWEYDSSLHDLEPYMSREYIRLR